MAASIRPGTVSQKSSTVKDGEFEMNLSNGKLEIVRTDYTETLAFLCLQPGKKLLVDAWNIWTASQSENLEQIKTQRSSMIGKDEPGVSWKEYHR